MPLENTVWDGFRVSTAGPKARLLFRRTLCSAFSLLELLIDVARIYDAATADLKENRSNAESRF